MVKTEATDKIKGIQVGKKDRTGNIIVDILAMGNEYIIYEIENNDINKQLRILIDGHTDESEELLTEKFSNIKKHYIKAKGLLYRSSNFGMMKSRVAHTLATALTTKDSAFAEKEFEELLQDLDNQYNRVLRYKLSYITPVTVITVVSLILNLYLAEFNAINSITIMWLGASCGGCLSLFISLKNLDYNEHPGHKYYTIAGFERYMLAMITSTIAYIGIRSGMILPEFSGDNDWTLSIVGVISGFSEKLIPNALRGLGDNVGKHSK